ncbi:MAG: type II toxin-antitoxin system HicB family antitoxin [Rhodospirillales bacterium]|nr:type II toxin-antitoxin system HicB family antitoxin [Rhodospirillales bacterium]
MVAGPPLTANQRQPRLPAPVTARDARGLTVWYHPGMSQQDLIPSREFVYAAVFEPAEEGGYVVTFPAIPDLATQGETLDDARDMAADCLRCYLEGQVRDGIPLPESDRPGSDAILGQVRVSLQIA